jgi:hypothetical protein
MLRVKPSFGIGACSYLVPHTGIRVQENDILTLVRTVRQHLDVNGFQTAVITREEIEDAWCRELVIKHYDCCEEYPTPKIGERTITLSDVVRFTRTMFKNAVGGFKRVDQDEAERRADICVRCPMNFSIGGCGACSGSGAAAAAIGSLIGDRKTSVDENLQSCKICGCFNKVQVWFPMEDLQAGMEQNIRDLLPDNCWKKV